MNKTVYVCNTQELANNFLKDCKEKNIRWISGDVATDNSSMWESRFKNNDYVVFYVEDKTLSFSSGRYWEKHRDDYEGCSVVIDPVVFEKEYSVKIVDDKLFLQEKSTNRIVESKCETKDVFGVSNSFTEALSKLRIEDINKNLNDAAKTILYLIKKLGGVKFVISYTANEICFVDEDYGHVATIKGDVIEHFQNFDEDLVYEISYFDVD